MAVLGLADRWPADAVGILADMGVLGVADMVRCRQLQLASCGHAIPSFAGALPLNLEQGVQGLVRSTFQYFGVMETTTTMPADQASPRAKPLRALALTVLVVSGIVLTDMAALREPAMPEGGSAIELSMTSYFDALARRDAAAAHGPLDSVQLALRQTGAVPSPSAAREEVSEQASKALGGGLEDARRGAARRLAPQSNGVQTRPRQREGSDIAADMKGMLRCVCHSHSAYMYLCVYFSHVQDYLVAVCVTMYMCMCIYVHMYTHRI